MIADLGKPEKSREINTKDITEAIYGGHYWALKWELSALFHDHIDSPGAVSLVVDTLDAWSFIEEAVEGFTPAQRAQLEKEVPIWGKNPEFHGFDGNYESEHFSIASHLVTHMGRFVRFKGRSLNSHSPKLAAYARLTRAFQPIRATLGGRRPIGLQFPEVVALLNAQSAPKD